MWQELEEAGAEGGEQDVAAGADAAAAQATAAALVAARARVGAAAASALASHAIDAPSSLLAIVDGDLLAAAGLLAPAPAGPDAWRRREVRAHTRLAYTQRKFNLLREEAEGYAKLLACLHGLGGGAGVEVEVARARPRPRPLPHPTLRPSPRP